MAALVPGDELEPVQRVRAEVGEYGVELESREGAPVRVVRNDDSANRPPLPQRQLMSDNYFCRSTTIRFAGSPTSGQPR